METKSLNYQKTAIFSDESSFSVVNPNARIFLRRSEDADYEDQIQYKTKSQVLIVWGAISYKGVGPWIRVEMEKTL